MRSTHMGQIIIGMHDYVVQNGGTALLWASFNGNTSTVEELLYLGADIHHKAHVR